MARIFRALAAALVTLVSVNAFAQNCDVANQTNMTCDTAISAGGSAQCTVSVKNAGTAPCVGNWTTTLGSFDPGTFSNVQANFANCTFVGDVQLPAPIFNQMVIHSAWVCQGAGSVGPGATLSMTGRVTPAPSFTNSQFLAAYLLTFRRTGSINGTQSLTAYGANPIIVNNCTAIPEVPGATPSGVPYVVSWNALATSGGYEIQEATKPDFSDAVTTSTLSASNIFQHSVTAASTFFYRVRPVSCGGSAGSFGPPAQIVVLPPQPPTARDFDIVVPFGSTTQVSQSVTFPGLVPNAPFTVTTDKPYLTVTPTSGTVRSDGTVTLTVRGDPSNRFVGANTGTIIVNAPAAKGILMPNDSRSNSTTVSISLVTPVNGNAKTAPPPNDALIVPAVAHVEGVVPFRSDIRITNAGSAAATYLLSFTPSNSDGTTTGRQTTITVQPDQTVALNDVLRDFFGFALSSDSAGGVLDIRVLAGSVATTFVSSRTYAATAAGTFGQFIPAVPVGKFLKSGGGSLTLTGVSQSDAFRSNIGLVEGFGAVASGRLRVFSSSGQSLGEFPFTLQPFEFQQLGSFLASKLGITATDARIEVVVDSPTGSVTTYASVLDNKTNDPLAVSPIQTASLSANRYVLPGMADFANAVSNFHSDIRIFNASPSLVNATATFYPQGNGTPIARTVGINTGEIKVYNNVLPTLFGATGGGAIVITTPNNTPLVVSGRTYSNDAKTGGTFGQFIPAVTPAEGIGLGDAPLQILQLEQSANFRSNLGVNELTGSGATIELTVTTPDSKVAGVLRTDLQPNEFKQFGNVLAQVFPGLNTYNGRIAVNVVGGSGRVTAYGSVVDNLTSDPTYVPAQK
ncbi:MAG: hypothetical protein M3041_19180 [Acidobacteriota bacterium]|nr:hypothetical protein [Acidobacteriota bacterium]